MPWVACASVRIKAVAWIRRGQDSLYLRLRLNDWIRTADVFDYVFDAEVVVREQREDGWYFREGIHMGDHLHPNAVVGQLLADAWDLDRLVGR